MAVPKTAEVLSSGIIGSNSRLILLQYQGEDFDQFISGKFIIVDTGLLGEGGKALKRAYSLLEVDKESKQFKLMVKDFSGTLGTQYMHGLQQNDRLSFSGPWGKFIDKNEGEDPVWVIATDTGFTACHGLIRSSIRSIFHFFWLQDCEDYLFSDFNCMVEYTSCIVPPVNRTNREVFAWEKLREETKAFAEPKTVFLAGDGDIILPFKERFERMGLPQENIMTEIFFNNPQKKST